jgi:hypothetical protein
MGVFIDTPQGFPLVGRGGDFRRDRIDGCPGARRRHAVEQLGEIQSRDGARQGAYAHSGGIAAQTRQAEPPAPPAIDAPANHRPAQEHHDLGDGKESPNP